MPLDGDDLVRLPSHLVPVRYDLSIEPDLDVGVFSGSVVIEFMVDSTNLDESNSNVIVLNAYDLSFSSASYCVKGESTKHDATNILTNVQGMTVTFVFDQSPIPATALSILLKIDYQGSLDTPMVGFYRSKYIDNYGKEQYMASTQFEP
jgi:hypothetical protein